MEVAWAIFVVTAVGLTALVFYSEWIKPDAGTGSSTSDRAQTVPRAIKCPHCGTENDRGYTYCATCIGKLAPEDNL